MHCEPYARQHRLPCKQRSAGTVELACLSACHPYHDHLTSSTHTASDMHSATSISLSLALQASRLQVYLQHQFFKLLSSALVLSMAAPTQLGSVTVCTAKVSLACAMQDRETVVMPRQRTALPSVSSESITLHILKVLQFSSQTLRSGKSMHKHQLALRYVLNHRHWQHLILL